jgi:hypothetical protein
VRGAALRKGQSSARSEGVRSSARGASGTRRRGVGLDVDAVDHPPVLQTPQMSSIGGTCARRLVPRTPVLVRILQTLQVSTIGGKRARVRVPLVPAIARQPHEFQVSQKRRARRHARPATPQPPPSDSPQRLPPATRPRASPQRLVLELAQRVVYRTRREPGAWRDVDGLMRM